MNYIFKFLPKKIKSYILFNKILNNNLNNIEYFLKFKIDLNYLYNNESLLSISCKKQNNLLIHFFLNKKKILKNLNTIHKNSIINLILNGNLELIKLLIVNGIDKNIEDKYSFPLIFVAFFNNKFDILKYLIDIDFNINFIYKNQFNLLYLSCIYENEELFDYLLTKNNININFIDINGNNLLLICSETGNLNMFKKLYNLGLNINHQNNCKKTAFINICDNNYIEFLDFLKTTNINYNLTDNLGNTGFIYACLNNYYNLINKLIPIVNIKILNNNCKTAFNLISNNSILKKQLFNEYWK